MAFGALLGQASSGGGGKRVCRFTVGTSTAGWTANDCDYLCDGTADQVEINAAIQALPAECGEVVILDGTYNITATIAMNKDNTKLSGNGASTIFKRMWNSNTTEGVITINAANGGCCVENLQIDNNSSITDTNNRNCGIYINSDNNTVTGNICSNNTKHYGIRLMGNNNIVTGNTCNNNFNGINLSGNNNTATGNTCNNNNNGISLSNNNNTVTGNTCNDNNSNGIGLSGNNNTVTGNTCNDNSRGINLYGNNNTVIGNTCIRGTGQASDYTNSQYTIHLDGTYSSYNLIACNNIMGKNYTSDGGTSNTFVNNKYN